MEIFLYPIRTSQRKTAGGCSAPKNAGIRRKEQLSQDPVCFAVQFLSPLQTKTNTARKNAGMKTIQGPTIVDGRAGSTIKEISDVFDIPPHQIRWALKYRL